MVLFIFEIDRTQDTDHEEAVFTVRYPVDDQGKNAGTPDPFAAFPFGIENFSFK